MKNHGFIRIAGATPRVRVADCPFNGQEIEALIRRAAEAGVELIAFPELSLTGATIGDLVLQPTLQEAAERELVRLVRATAECPIVSCVGLPVATTGGLYNCAVLFAEGAILGVVPKAEIPNHAGAGQGRWFTPGADLQASLIALGGEEVPFGSDLLFEINGTRYGVVIGEELQRPVPASVELTRAGASIIINPAAEPELAGRHEGLKERINAEASRLKCGYLYVSAGFGESTTDLVFSGNVLISDQGEWQAVSRRFSLEEQLVMAEIDSQYIAFERRRLQALLTPSTDREWQLITCHITPQSAPSCRRFDPHPFIPSDPAVCRERCEEVLQIQSLGLAKRLLHTGSRCAVMGISGGLDSTLALLVVVRAFDLLGLDRKQIHGITMPGFGTSGRTYRNALALMQELGITRREISIVPAVKQHLSDIGLEENDRSAAYENGQARERTQILMDYANKEGGLVIGTGDLSELALGWATYNGDQMSMYGVNGSIPKSLVRHLVRHLATEAEEPIRRILLDVVDTPVSPELLPTDQAGEIAQKTEDLVGPYELHDFMLYHLLRRGYGPAKLLFAAEQAFEGGYSRREILHWMRTLIRRFFSQQFKRSAMPDGPKTGSVGLSPRGDWQMPSDGSATCWLQEIDTLENL